MSDAVTVLASESRLNTMQQAFKAVKSLQHTAPVTVVRLPSMTVKIVAIDC